MSLREFIESVISELRVREEIKEEIESHARKILHKSKKAILLTHRNALKKAKELLKEARESFLEIKSICDSHPEMIHTGLVEAAMQEYAEAYIFINLVSNGKFTPPAEVAVSSSAYVLGLADVIGELRRRALDSLRKGELDQAEECLNLMEEIYIELMSVEDAYLLVPGLRRKCDIARRIIEATRGDLTIEARRKALEEAVKKLEETLGKKGEM